MIAYFIAQVIWLLTAFLANAVITLFAFAFSLDLVNGNGSPGSGALTPVSDAIHNLYTNTFGAPWLVAAVVLAGCWAMWKALVQRRYTETAGALAVSLLYCVLAIGIVTQPATDDRTGEQALKPALHRRCCRSPARAASATNSRPRPPPATSSSQLLVLDPWTVLEFGGIEHCTTTTGTTRRSRSGRLSADRRRRTRSSRRSLKAAREVHARQGKTCINNRNKYAPHFLAYPFQSKERNSEHEALEHGDTGDLPSSDPGKTNGYLPARSGG